MQSQFDEHRFYNKNSLELAVPTNATLSGKELLAKMLNEVKTANCFLSV
jgi:hypothetical protein